MKKIVALIIIALAFSCRTTNINSTEVTYTSPYTAPYKSEFVDRLNHPFPRLAMWWPSSWYQDVEELARYDYIGWGYWEDPEALKEIKRLNPNQLHFMSGTITETSWGFWGSAEFKELASKIPGEYFLTSNGSNLAKDINSSETSIEVLNLTNSTGEELFQIGDTLVCGFESMLIVEIDKEAKSLIVERGFYREATDHKKGERISPHVTFWPESWVMNLSELCPKVDIDGGSYNWREWSVKFFLTEFYPNIMDGYILDRLEDTQSWLVGGYTKSISPDFTNGEIDDYSEFDRAWKEGITNALLTLREDESVKYIVANSFGYYYKFLDGSIYEGMPTNWNDSRELTYREWATENTPFMLGDSGYINVSLSTNPNFSFVESYEVSQWYSGEEVEEIAKREPNYQHMRFGLTSALLGNGYFSYETSTQGHGALRLYWFDEYDIELGYPLGEAEVILTLEDGEKLFAREFENGLAICNPTDKYIRINLETPWFSVKGKKVYEVQLEPRDGVVLLREK